MPQIPTRTISIDLPNDILLALNETETELKQRVRMALAVQLFKLQKLTLGKAAQLAGLSRLRFENLLADNAIAISSLTLEEVMDDARKMK
jgi:predicted HTH domain antitoxin